MKETFGYASLEWKEGIDWSRVRAYRLARAREAVYPEVRRRMAADAGRAAL